MSAEKSKDVKSVAFSRKDSMDQQLLEYASKQGYFSTYIKRLIQRDMENGQKQFYDQPEKDKVKSLEEENNRLRETIEQIKKLVID